MKKRQWFVILFALVVAGSFLYAQNGKDDVRLFQSFFYDAPIVTNNVVEGAFQYDTYDGWKMLQIGGRGNYALNEKTDLGASFGYVSMSPDEGDGESGLSDLSVFGRHKLSEDDKKQVSVGAMITLPIGTEEVGGGDLDFAGFGAFRYNMDNGMILCGTAGLHFIETETFEDGEEGSEHKTALYLGVGNIYNIDEKMNLVSELTVVNWEFEDFMMVSTGIDMKSGKGRIRGMIGLGLTDAAPDFSIFGAYQIILN